MALTTKSDLIVPEVWADMLAAEFVGKVRVMNLARSVAGLEGQPGDTIHFPKFLPLGDADLLTEGTAMTPVTLETSDDTAVIKEAGKAVEMTDTALLTALGDPEDEVRRQFARVIARRIDADLITEAASAGANVSSVSAPLGRDAIADALDTFGDDADAEDFAGIVIHSKQRTALLKDDDFVRADSFGDGSVLRTGQIGEIYGIPVIVSDRVPVTTGTPDTYSALLIKNGALGVIYKRRPLIEQDRDILARTNVLTVNVHYAVKRLDDDGICVLTTQA